MSRYYTSGQEIIDKYHKLYKPVFKERHLYFIFNDEHDYDVSDAEFADEDIMLTMGHYFSLEDEDMNKAKFYYNKVTNLNSAYGLYSLGVFFYTKKSFPRARLYATNGLNLHTKGSTDCAILLHNISIDQQDFENAGKYLLDEIERLRTIQQNASGNMSSSEISSSEALLLVQKLVNIMCIFYINISNQGQKVIDFDKKYPSVSTKATVAMYYYRTHDPDGLLMYANIMVANNVAFGNYFMGLYSYLLFVLMCKHKQITRDTLDDALEHLVISENWFNSVLIRDDTSEELSQNTKVMINKIIDWRHQFEAIKSNIANTDELIVV